MKINCKKWNTSQTLERENCLINFDPLLALFLHAVVSTRTIKTCQDDQRLYICEEAIKAKAL